MGISSLKQRVKKPRAIVTGAVTRLFQPKIAKFNAWADKRYELALTSTENMVKSVFIFLAVFLGTGLTCSLLAIILTEVTIEIRRMSGEYIGEWQLIWRFVLSFTAFVILGHAIVLFCAFKLGKFVLISAEYTYLTITALGLIALTPVISERFSLISQSSLSSVKIFVGMINDESDYQSDSICKQPGATLPSSPTETICNTLKRMKALSDRAIRIQSNEVELKLLEKDISKLLSDGELKDTEEGVEGATTKIMRYDVTPRQWQGINRYKDSYSQVKSLFENLIRNAEKYIVAEETLMAARPFSFITKYFGFYLLSFAIALRISKLTAELLNITRKNAEAEVE